MAALPLQVGDTCYLDYGEAPQVIHCRLILDVVDRSTHDFIVLTPDYDIYTEQLDGSNVDLTDFHRSDARGGPPPGIPVGAVYSFCTPHCRCTCQFHGVGAGGRRG